MKLSDHAGNAIVSKLLGHLDVHGEGLCQKVLMPVQIVPNSVESNSLDSAVLMWEAIIEFPLRTRKVLLRDLARL